jgi:plastocyanin
MSNTISRFRTLAIAASIVTWIAAFWTNAQAGQGHKSPQNVAIEIDNFKFGMASLQVTVETTVTWTNRDDVPHTVTSSKKVFKSPPLDTGETFSYTFKEAGSFEYYCSLHPHMTGKVVVK